MPLHYYYVTLYPTIPGITRSHSVEVIAESYSHALQYAGKYHPKRTAQSIKRGHVFNNQDVKQLVNN